MTHTFIDLLVDIREKREHFDVKHGVLLSQKGEEISEDDLMNEDPMMVCICCLYTQQYACSGICFSPQTHFGTFTSTGATLL